MKRTHDSFYVNENSMNVKDSFVAVANIIGDEFVGDIADVGCAAGAFPRYLRDRFKQSRILGIEYLDDLLNKAKSQFPDIEFVKGDVTQKDSINEKFDVVTMLGVLGIFDDYATVICNALSWLKPGGRLIIHSMISNYDVDVFIKYKPSSDIYKSEDLESGWNIISKKSLQMLCDKMGAELVDCREFKIGVDLAPNPNDPMRSWTEVDAHGDRKIYNALHLRQPQQIAVIQIP